MIGGTTTVLRTGTAAVDIVSDFHELHFPSALDTNTETVCTRVKRQQKTDAPSQSHQTVPRRRCTEFPTRRCDGCSPLQAGAHREHTRINATLFIPIHTCHRSRHGGTQRPGSGVRTTCLGGLLSRGDGTSAPSPAPGVECFQPDTRQAVYAPKISVRAPTHTTYRLLPSSSRQ